MEDKKERDSTDSDEETQPDVADPPLKAADALTTFIRLLEVCEMVLCVSDIFLVFDSRCR